jgi:hypothetical protein
MPDWTRLVRERLDIEDLSPNQQKDTIAELASHLDDVYAEYRERGLNESESTQRAIQEVPDWRSLARHIRRAKQEEGMNHRTQQLWLPAMINLTIAMAVLTFEVRMDLHPQFYVTHSPAMLIYVPWIWIVSLPFCGALAAYLCRRAGGDRLVRLATASFPAAGYFGCFMLVLLVAQFGPDAPVPWGVVGMLVSTWALMPAAALLLGALPFLKAGKPAGSPALS